MTAGELNTMASELKITLDILKALLLSYGDEYATPTDKEIMLNLKARPGVAGALYAAVEDYAAKALSQAEALDKITMELLRDKQENAQ